MSYFDSWFDWEALTGSLVSATDAIDRWTPVVLRFRLSPGRAPFLLYRTGQLEFCAYSASRINQSTLDPQSGYSGDFVERSTYETDGDVIIMSILPSGGWSVREFQLTLIGGQEII